MNRTLGILYLLLIFSFNYGQSNFTCQNALPVCPWQPLTYQGGVNAGSAIAGPNYGCLGSQPNPAWYYIKIDGGGAITIQMSASNDIDYICYGPFNTLSGACNSLTAGNTVGCSYSGSPTETLMVPNAIPGEYYLILISNFCNQTQNITINQTSGPGSFQCYYMTAPAICAGEQSTITINQQMLANPSYTLFPGNVSTFTSSFIVSPSITTNYTVICSGVNSQNMTQVISNTLNVTVYPSPNLIISNGTPTICSGQSATFYSNGALTYSWSTGWPYPNITITPTVTTTYTVSGTSISGCTTTSVVIQYVDNCTSLRDLLSGTGDLSLWPNPANDVVNINLKQLDFPLLISICNQFGEKIKEIPFVKADSEISINDLNVGVYTITFQNRNETISRKFIVLR